MADIANDLGAKHRDRLILVRVGEFVVTGVLGDVAHRSDRIEVTALGDVGPLYVDGERWVEIHLMPWNVTLRLKPEHPVELR